MLIFHRVVAANVFTQGMELQKMTQTQILQQLMVKHACDLMLINILFYFTQQRKQYGTKSPLFVQYPSNNNSLLNISQRSPASHDVTARSPTPYSLAS